MNGVEVSAELAIKIAEDHLQIRSLAQQVAQLEAQIKSLKEQLAKQEDMSQ